MTTCMPPPSPANGSLSTDAAGRHTPRSQRILLAIEGTSPSHAFLTQLRQRDWPEDAEVRLITVLSPIEANALAGPSQLILGELMNVQRTEARRQLEEAAERLKGAAPQLSTKFIVRTGDPAEVILDEARRYGADQIIVGSKRRARMLRWWGDSTAAQVSRHAGCPVEIVSQ
ncbi:universal stress protein [Schlesneria sp. T3-172]|uniref:universal stress protein n=1 Tax=Schlesneria sphaerica TaxID=3373610 RepID=UPI0037C6231C